MRLFKIPASITLSQALVETNAGTSELAINAYNHFGIKCKEDWYGDTYKYTDDLEDELLEKYKDDEKIMHIGGNFFQHRNKKFNCKDSYYFSTIPHIWGWASWSRAWKFYDSDIKIWPKIKSDGSLRKTLSDPAVYEYWETVWDGYYNHMVPSWDGQWTLALMLKNGLSITPTKNLVTNIGFGPNAMQTKDENSIFANMPLEPMYFPLIHPKNIEINKQADDFTWKQNFGVNRYWKQRLLGPIRRNFPSIYKPIRNLFKK
jgi:hypothetical protein